MNKSLLAFLAAWTLFAEGEQTAALEGLDPVLLTEGQEVPGKQSLSLRSGRFLYQFVNEETRTRFKADPEKYGIQLDGACARMGPPVSGSPDSYSVYNGHIYVFGSSECYRKFSATPAKYLESEQPKCEWKPSSDSASRAQATLKKTVDAMGGETMWHSVKSYAETRHQRNMSGEVIVRVAAEMPDHYVMRTFLGSHVGGVLLTPSGLIMFRDEEGKTRPPTFGRAIEADWKRDLIPLLLERSKVEMYSGAKNEISCRNDEGVFMLRVDPASGRIAGRTWQGRGADGFGHYQTTFSDYRKVSGFYLPFVVETTFDGKRDDAHSWTVEFYELNPADIGARLKGPARVLEP